MRGASSASLESSQLHPSSCHTISERVLRSVIVEPEFRQNRVRVLTEQGRRAVIDEGRVGKANRTHDLRHRAAKRMRQVLEHSAVADLRRPQTPVRTSLIGALGTPAASSAATISCLRPCLEFDRQQIRQFDGHADARGICLEARILSPLRTPEHIAQLAELPVIADGENEEAILAERRPAAGYSDADCRHASAFGRKPESSSPDSQGTLSRHRAWRCRWFRRSPVSARRVSAARIPGCGIHPVIRSTIGRPTF